MINSKLLLKKFNMPSQGILNSKETLASPLLFWKRAVSSGKQTSVLCTDSLNKTQAASALKLRIGNTNCPKAQSKGRAESAHPQSSTALEVLGEKKLANSSLPAVTHTPSSFPWWGSICGPHISTSPFCKCTRTRVQRRKGRLQETALFQRYQNGGINSPAPKRPRACFLSL